MLNVTKESHQGLQISITMPLNLKLTMLYCSSICINDIELGILFDLLEVHFSNFRWYVQDPVILKNTDHIVFIFSHNVPLVEQCWRIGIRTMVAMKTAAILDFKGKLCAQLSCASFSRNCTNYHWWVVFDVIQTQMKRFFGKKI